jgi:hypothetical protein
MPTKRASWCGRAEIGLTPNTEVGGTAFAAIIGSTSRRAILDSINWIQPLRSPTSCAAKHGTAYGPSNFGIRFEQASLKHHHYRISG